VNLRKEWRGERGKAQHLIDHTLAVSMRRRIGRRRRKEVEVEDVIRRRWSHRFILTKFFTEYLSIKEHPLDMKWSIKTELEGEAEEVVEEEAELVEVEEEMVEVEVVEVEVEVVEARTARTRAAPLRRIQWKSLSSTSREDS